MGETIKYNNVKWKMPILIGIPTEGLVRFEWAHARYGQIIPVNWSATGFDLAYIAAGYSVADAYNLICQQAIEKKVEWLLTVEDDVLLPPDCFLRIGKYMEKGDVPVVSGLYYTKGNPAEPLIFRGRGNGAFRDFKMGAKVWFDGLPMGCLLLHMSIIRYMWNTSPGYRAPDGTQLREIFKTPGEVHYDPENFSYTKKTGTQDLYFFDRVMKENVLKETGWKNRRKYPFLCDTGIFCKHIDRNNGRQYP